MNIGRQKNDRCAQVFVAVSKTVFKIFFRRRVLIAEQNLRRSNIFHDSKLTPQQSKALIDRSLTHLGLTLYQSLKRALYFRRRYVLPHHPLTNEESRQFLEKNRIELCSDVDLRTLSTSRRGIIFISAHLGAWEELIILSALIDRPLFIISKRMKLSWAQRLWDRSRRSAAARLDQGKHRGRSIIGALQRRECIGAVLDQHDPRPSAIKCSFLGRVAATSPDLVRAALITNALIVPVFLARNCSHDLYTRRLHIFSPIDPQLQSNHLGSRTERITYLTQRCCDEIEKAIVMYPSQWLWIHRRWKLD